MRVRHLAFAASLAAATMTAGARADVAGTQRPPLVRGQVITQSGVWQPGVYRFASGSLDAPAITIRGSHLTLDFSGVTLAGAYPDRADPDRLTGLGVLVDGGDDVTIRNLHVRGFKVGLLARGTSRLHVTGGDFSYGWKARLYSVITHESLLDWLSYHDNEHDEWLAGGAGVYLAGTDAAQIDHTRIVQGQNGLMLARSNGAKIWDNTFSFLSGVGIGLYRSSRNTIMHNRVDWCVRGYSDGFYNRGQDSAGILVYEQSSHNAIAFNSVTHGGDGLFLWAGQSTLDSGEGGANDNVVYANDFSYAPANGIEATFSRNTFDGNRVDECWHGMWGGYSFDSSIANNRFARNVEAIAIEHGQDNRITGNRFDHDETAIHLWANAQDPGWAYPKHHDTRSRDYEISGNQFVGNKTAVDIHGTRSVRMAGNEYRDVATMATLTGDTRDFGLGADVSVPLRPRRAADATLPQPLPGAIDPMLPDDSPLRNRRSIIVDEWGPYDWKSPKLWPAGRPDAQPLRLQVLGPPGRWTLASARGAAVEPSSGTVPGAITVAPSGTTKIVDYDVRLIYRGAAVTSPRGRTVAAGAPYPFGYSRFVVPIDWRVRFFGFSAAAAPDKDAAAFAKVLDAAPLRTESRDRLDVLSGGEIAPGLPKDDVAMVASGAVTLPPGSYRLRTISDDGVRVWVDGALAIDHWSPHESALDVVPLTGGAHRLRVEYFELSGFAELRLEIVKP
ncbi:MAG TPA: NosD domain-containing protein [Vicinamibacterales bacterium]|nr:NosD domain-containing protein [Vicinamibacterales bacterium]